MPTKQQTLPETFIDMKVLSVVIGGVVQGSPSLLPVLPGHLSLFGWNIQLQPVHKSPLSFSPFRKQALVQQDKSLHQGEVAQGVS